MCLRLDCSWLLTRFLSVCRGVAAASCYTRTASYEGQKLLDCPKQSALVFHEMDAWEDHGNVTTVRARDADELQRLSESGCTVVHDDVEAIVTEWETAHIKALKESEGRPEAWHTAYHEYGAKAPSPTDSCLCELCPRALQAQPRTGTRTPLPRTPAW